MVRAETERRVAIVSTEYQQHPFLPHHETIRAKRSRGPGFKSAASRDWLMKVIGLDSGPAGVVFFTVDMEICAFPYFLG